MHENRTKVLREIIDIISCLFSWQIMTAFCFCLFHVVLLILFRKETKKIIFGVHNSGSSLADLGVLLFKRTCEHNVYVCCVCPWHLLYDPHMCLHILKYFFVTCCVLLFGCWDWSRFGKCEKAFRKSWLITDLCTASEQLFVLVRLMQLPPCAWGHLYRWEWNAVCTSPIFLSSAR